MKDENRKLGICNVLELNYHHFRADFARLFSLNPPFFHIRKPFRILKSIYMWYDIIRIDLRRNQQHYMNQRKGEKKLP